MLRIKLVRSLIGNNKRNRAIVQALGLRKINQTVDHPDTPSVRGMVHRVKHMLEVTQLADGDARPNTYKLKRPRTAATSNGQAAVKALPEQGSETKRSPRRKGEPIVESVPDSVMTGEAEAKPKRTRKAAAPKEEK